MPTYEYRCEKCDNRIEVFASMSAPGPEQCESCQAVGSMVKVLFAPAVHYKGSGFYATDYAGSGASAKAQPASDGASSGSSDASSGSSSGSSESSSGSSSSGDSSSSSSSSSSSASSSSSDS